ncbi:unnamed protein product [Nippostrongylus brasiliensis]|uniref:Uncharacterized protein n=1 Tax=Nippostrongylus brasiliensis TaxID=27835 RepID=A0A0N4YI23_NIPBR|nr:hypothetical protein Q1695_013730 [Nippostrongylus brasiliensis]VDL80134.1 unnamed protein product [Nippostrongylus brasiliensis]
MAEDEEKENKEEKKEEKEEKKEEKDKKKEEKDDKIKEDRTQQGRVLGHLFFVANKVRKVYKDQSESKAPSTTPKAGTPKEP